MTHCSLKTCWQINRAALRRQLRGEVADGLPRRFRTYDLLRENTDHLKEAVSYVEGKCVDGTVHVNTYESRIEGFEK